MFQSTLPSWAYGAVLLILLIIAGVGQYFGLLPVNTFNTVFLLVVGLIAPSPLFPHTSVPTAALAQNTAATQANTVAMTQPPTRG